MRMRICKTVPQGQGAYEVEIECFFPGAVAGEGGGYPLQLSVISTFKINLEGYANTHVH